MEIPKVLAVGNVAVRIMYTKYDHLSPLSKSFYPKLKVKPPEVVVEEAEPVEETAVDGVSISTYNCWQKLVMHYAIHLAWIQRHFGWLLCVLAGYAFPPGLSCTKTD